VAVATETVAARTFSACTWAVEPIDAALALVVQGRLRARRVRLGICPCPRAHVSASTPQKRCARVRRCRTAFCPADPAPRTSCRSAAVGAVRQGAGRGGDHGPATHVLPAPTPMQRVARCRTAVALRPGPRTRAVSVSHRARLDIGNPRDPSTPLAAAADCAPLPCSAVAAAGPHWRVCSAFVLPRPMFLFPRHSTARQSRRCSGGMFGHARPFGRCCRHALHPAREASSAAQLIIFSAAVPRVPRLAPDSTVAAARHRQGNMPPPSQARGSVQPPRLPIRTRSSASVPYAVPTSGGRCHPPSFTEPPPIAFGIDQHAPEAARARPAAALHLSPPRPHSRRSCPRRSGHLRVNSPSTRRRQLPWVPHDG